MRVAGQEGAVDSSMNQGFVLTRYFYESLPAYEKDEPGFRSAVGQMIARIDIRREQRRTSGIQFAAAADPELLQLARPKQGKLLINAQERLSAGDAAGAEKLARQALAEESEQHRRPVFLLDHTSL